MKVKKQAAIRIWYEMCYYYCYYRSPEDAGRGPEVIRSSLGVSVGPLGNKLSIFDFISRYCIIVKDITTLVSKKINCNRKRCLQEPETTMDSHRTTTIFFPSRSCLATMEARRPNKWPLPSTTIVSAIIQTSFIITN